LGTLVLSTGHALESLAAMCSHIPNMDAQMVLC